MEFSKLRLSGFKSFADPTELVIEPGLTGVVGPNGCGKSNLLEALRWVMGESSYKNMRGSGMEDVIFAGSTGRPGRNMAEVTLFLDNNDKAAPAEFNGEDTLEITRRIEHEAGSAYRINGKDVRARDVQLLFADQSTGAHSPALVRQGQISELIDAKPAARRRILEEAAGITGLHTRRHEAQLRLNAAETNLTRLEDVTGQLEAQLASLKRQARQASRYRNVSAEIRKSEAIALYLRWSEAAGAVETAARELDDIRKQMAEKTVEASKAETARGEAADALPQLREAETRAAAALQRVLVERDGLDKDQERAEARVKELTERLDQARADLARERDTVSETDGIIEKLEAEAHTLQQADAGADDAAAQTTRTLDEAGAALHESEKLLDDASRSLAQIKARHDALERVVDEQSTRRDRFRGELDAARAELAAKEKDAKNAETGPDGAALDEAQGAVLKADEAVSDAERTLSDARAREAQARAAHEEKHSAAQALDAERRALSKLLKVRDDDLWPPLIDALTVEPGYEVALGAALGDDLDVPLDDAAPVHWDTLEGYDSPATLPDGIEPLSARVKAPAALDRRLGQTGIVAADQGDALHSALKPGQRLVSPDGDLWRWDGYRAAADAPTAAAQRLGERNRLIELETLCGQANTLAEQALSALQAARQQTQNAEDALGQARNAWRQANDALSAAQNAATEQARAASARAARIATLMDNTARFEADIAEAEAAIETARGELASLQDGMPADAELDKLRAVVAERRAAFAEAKSAHDGLAREAQARANRLSAIAAEQTSWRARTQKASNQISELENRITTLDGERIKAAQLPDEFEARRKALLDTLGDAEKTRQGAADRLAELETRHGALSKDAREKDAALADIREEAARIETRLEAAQERKRGHAGDISDTLHIQPDEVPDSVGLKDNADLPSADDIEARLEKLERERERLGAVNLRAEEEAAEIAQQLDDLTTERDDVIEAIAKLRQGISSLNSEGRGRLLAAFDTVNENFKRLYGELFGGGEAHLELVEADDPLEAGLEIFARPPGKRLQPLTLLSGGEQALTAMSLILAVFLTNPAPICVLDEVDAALDDANVQRFCNLMTEMTRNADTRYLIITHHPLTMARMNRLFGVTMGERGVSQLVSVDLETAERFREAG